MAAKKRGGVHGSRSKSSAHRRTPDDEMWRAWKLYRAGMTYRDIGRIMDRATATAFELVGRARKAIAEVHGEELKQEIHERQRAIIAAHMRTRTDPDSAKVIQACDKILIGMYGLEAPKRTELTGAEGGPLQVQDVTSLSDEQLLAIARGQAQESDARGVGDGAAPSEGGARASTPAIPPPAPVPDELEG